MSRNNGVLQVVRLCGLGVAVPHAENLQLLWTTIGATVLALRVSELRVLKAIYHSRYSPTSDARNMIDSNNNGFMDARMVGWLLGRRLPNSLDDHPRIPCGALCPQPRHRRPTRPPTGEAQGCRCPARSRAHSFLGAADGNPSRRVVGTHGAVRVPRAHLSVSYCASGVGILCDDYHHAVPLRGGGGHY